MELDAKTLRTDEVIRGAFKTFEGQAGYMASKSKNALGSILSKEFLSNSVIKGGFKGAALGVAAGTLTTAVDRWLHPDGQIDNGVINGVSVLARSAAVGAIGGIGATAAIGALRNIKSNYSSEIAKEAFQIGKEGNFGARALAFAGRRLGGNVFMGAAALGASAYIGGKVLKSIVSTNLTRPSDGAPLSPNPLVHLI